MLNSIFLNVLPIYYWEVFSRTFSDTRFYLCGKCLKSLLSELFFSWSTGHKEMVEIQQGGQGQLPFSL